MRKGKVSFEAEDGGGDSSGSACVGGGDVGDVAGGADTEDIGAGGDEEGAGVGAEGDAEGC